MAGSTYSTNLKIELMTTGENSGTWGDVTNTNLGTALEQAVVGYGNPDYVSDANLTISITNSNAAQAARALVLNVTSTFGSLTATRELVVPTIQKQYIVQNNTAGGQSITVKTSAGTGITVPNGRKAHLYVNGTDVIQMFDFVDINGGTIDGTAIGGSSASTGAFTTLNASGATTLDGNVTLGNASGDTVTVTGTISSNLLFTDNAYDIGASGATRPRNLFLAGAATIGGNLSVGGTLTLTGGLTLNGNVTVGDSSSDTLTINSTITSNLLFTDNTYDIGASGATRPRNLFLAGNATIGGNQTLTGALTVDSTTDSSSTTTGSIQTDGGLGVAKAAFIGTNLNVAGSTTLGTATIGTNKLAVGGNIVLNADSPTITFAGTFGTDGTHYLESSGTNDQNFKIRVHDTLYLNTRASSGTYYDRMTIDNVGGVTFKNTGDISGNSSFSINGSEAILYRNLLFSADNTYDIGASGATRPRNIYLAGTAGAVTAGLSTGTTQTYLKTQHSLNAIEFGIFANGKGYASSNGNYDFQIFRNSVSIASFTASGIQLDQVGSGVYSGSASSAITFVSGAALTTATTGSAISLFPSSDATFGSDVHLLTGSAGSSKKFVFWNYSGSFNRLATLDSTGSLLLGSGTAATGTKLDVFAGSNTSGTSVAIFRNLSGSNALVINVQGTASQGGTQVLDVGAASNGLSATFVGNVVVGPSTSATEALNVYSNASNSAKLDINASVSGQAGINIRAGSGTTYRASRIDFFQTPASSSVPRWTFINDYDQNNTNDMRLYSGAAGAPVMSWEPNKSVALQGATPTAGIGITFPAAQSGSSNANTLDDYEEGSWTPAINTDNSNMSVSYAVQVGGYTKIGNFVHARGYILTNSISSQGTGSVVITGLPFAQTEEVNFNFSDGAIMRAYYSASGATQLYGYCTGGKMYFRGGGPGGNYRSFNTGSVSSDYMLFTITYQVS